MNNHSKNLRLEIENEKEKVTDLTIEGRKHAERANSLSKTIEEKDQLIGEYSNKMEL